MSQDFPTNDIDVNNVPPAESWPMAIDAINALHTRFSGTGRPTGDACVAGMQWLDTDYDTDRWAVYTVVDPADSALDVLDGLIDTTTGERWTPGAVGSNGIYNGLLNINQKDLVLNGVPVAAVDGDYQIDQHITTLAGVTCTIQLLSATLPDGSTSNALRHTATSTLSGQLGSSQLKDKFEKYAGKKETQSRWVKSNNPNARLILDDGVTKASSDPHSGSAGWELLKVTATVDAAPTLLELHAVIATAALDNVSITSTDYIEFADARLDPGAFRLSGDREEGPELALCQKSFAKSLNQAIAPGTADNNGRLFTNANGTTNLSVLITWFYPVTMRGNPSVTVYSPPTGASGNFRNESTSSDEAASLSSAGETSCTFRRTASGGTDNNLYSAHFTASAEIQR